jgi:hypothetical protein
MFRYSLYAKPHLSKGLLSASPCVTTVGFIPDNTGIAGPSRGPYHVAPTGGGTQDVSPLVAILLPAHGSISEINRLALTYNMFLSISCLMWVK